MEPVGYPDSMPTQPERQRSLVAYFGGGAEALHPLLEICRNRIAALIGRRYRPLQTARLHCTLVGLEQLTDEPSINANFFRLRGERRAMDLRGYLSTWKTGGDTPRTIRFGGYAPNQAPFLSRGRTPYERSFSIQGNRVVLIGWPEPDVEALGRLRRDAEPFGILHAYHRLHDDLDIDGYLRIGTIEGVALSPEESERIETSVRHDLARSRPIHLPWGAEGLRVVSYLDESLPLETTTASELPAAIEKL